MSVFASVGKLRECLTEKEEQEAHVDFPLDKKQEQLPEPQCFVASTSALWSWNYNSHFLRSNLEAINAKA